MFKRSGFTIVEMLLYMGLLTIFLFILTQIFTSVTNLQLETETASSVQQDGRYILSRLSYDVKRSQSNYSPTTALTPTQAIIEPTGPGVGSDQLRLTINGTLYIYSINGSGNLVINDGTAANLNGYDTLISPIGTTPVFYRYGNTNGKNSITINFQVTSRAKQPGKGAEVKTYTSTVSTR